MNTKITLIAIVALFATTATFAQVGIGTTDPDAMSWQQAKKTKHCLFFTNLVAALAR